MNLSNQSNWSVIESYFKEDPLHQLVKHQIDSYNDFIQTQIFKTIEMFNPLTVHSPHDYYQKLNKYRLDIEITFTNFCIYRPEIHENNGSTKIMFPNKARLRNCTYTSHFTLDLNIKYIIRTGDTLENEEIRNVVLPKIHFGKIPIMLKSCLCVLNQYPHLSPEQTEECKMDPGGYFIINGSEKICLGQEKPADNKIFCFKQKPGLKWLWNAEFRSVPDWKCISPKQVYMMISAKSSSYGHEIVVQLTRLKRTIPLFVLFRALGVESDKDICEIITLNNNENPLILNKLKASIEKGSEYDTYRTSFEYVMNSVTFCPINMDKEEGYKKKYEFAQEVLDNDLFPHCKTKTERIYFLGYMTNKLISHSLDNNSSGDDRDSYVNKRIELTGTLLNNLFRNYFNKVVKDMGKQIVREINNGSWKSTEDYTKIITMTNIYKIVKSSTIENGIKRSLSTGDFGIKNTNSNKVGVAQVLNRLTYMSTLSHTRRINTPIDKSGKLIEPRKLHSSGWGFVCPVESPEGQAVGVVKNYSILTTLSNHGDSTPIHEYVEPYTTKLVDNSPTLFYNKTKIIINGRWIGVTDRGYELYLDLKQKKYNGILHIYTSIIFNYVSNEIYVCNDCGRMLRPLYRVHQNKLYITEDIADSLKSGKYKWCDLLLSNTFGHSIIEYIDAEEQHYSMISTNHKQLDKPYRYTHCEIHPCTIFGIMASCIPFPHHNQSPRNTYQCAMGKQAIGVYVSNFNHRMDKTAYVLNYAMRPLVETRVMNMVKLNELPSGNQVIVAIMTHGGYNQEDSVLLNKGSIDRGLFQATVYHTEKDEDKKINGEEELHIKPNEKTTRNMKFGNYDKINREGVINKDELIEDKDIIMAKVTVIKENKNDSSANIKYEDQSRTYRTNEECYVDKSYLDRNGDGFKFTKVRIRSMRTPIIGDKFSSRHGQKGTVGNIINEEDMPFTKTGLRPDIIINPHAIPSRMTIAQLKETLLGKLLLELGAFGDGSSFEELDMNVIFDELQKLNYESKGNEILYNGQTGEQITTSIFMGPVYYQRLKHMVADKQHSRCIGPMVNLTRQPAEGRSRDGGLRFGEMERDCMISHGASKFTKERIYDVSDKYGIYVCKQCGIQAIYNDKEHIHLCKMCDNRTSFSYVKIPYSCKLLFQELMTINVVPRIMT